jgi:hypothetical protein
MLDPAVEVIVRSNRRLCADNYPRGVGGCSLIDVRMTIQVPSVTLAEFTTVEQDRYAGVFDALVGTSHNYVYVSGSYADSDGRLSVTVAVTTSVALGLALRMVCVVLCISVLVTVNRNLHHCPSVCSPPS